MDVESSAAIARSEALGKTKSAESPSIPEEDRSIGHGDVLGSENVDQVLAAKMNLVNDVSLLSECELERRKCAG